MSLSLGQIVDGKVTGITHYGAFVSLPEGKTGMVHISEVSRAYVTNIEEYLKVGQDVKVKIINIDENGRINLSIRKAVEEQEPRVQPNRFNKSEQKSQSSSFEDKLKQFLQDSESRMSDLKRHESDKIGGGKR